MNLIWLGHSAFRIELGAAVILIDPFLTGNPKFTGDPERAAEGATHILLTHGHDDHVGDAVKIAKATGAQIISNFEVCMYVNAGRGKYQPRQHGGHDRLRRVQREPHPGVAFVGNRRQRPIHLSRQLSSSQGTRLAFITWAIPMSFPTWV
jgi:glyoxylase-like metal-dependent hydrolase (beta-lactamase superfamily II)